ncbi:hypothetical protein F5Y19DRAFT_187146 [Xylariaceae sp. FL1651]|nr:hypothetical protein F5Y19DRAFT_187146 [Xylariaceae sp. FL1651]
MGAAAVQVPQSSALTPHPQPSATTAPVREHACLFTHDLRRKQKRWQDGRLKYHTFNRRIMVHDERGNFIGDTHWREDYDLSDGDELELERGGIIVQVGECTGSRDQDLSELIDKRAQERAQRQAAAAARRPPAPQVATLHVVAPHALPHKHLHSVIGAPSGHHGRAVVPSESPYEERRERQAGSQSDNIRPVKRQKTDVSPPSRNGYAHNLFGATLTLSGRSLSQAPVHYRLPKVQYTREDITSPPSAITSTYDGDSNHILNRMEIAVVSQNTHDRPQQENIAQGSNAQASTKSLAGPHSSAEPDLSSSPSLNLANGRNENHPVHHSSESRLNAKVKPTGVHAPPISLTAPRNVRNPSKPDVTLEKAGLDFASDDEQSTKEISKISRDNKKSTIGSYQAQGRTPEGPNIIDLTERRVHVSPKPPVVDGPTTELRIKPRKKRGLLIISGQDALRDFSSKSEATESTPDYLSLSVSSNVQAIGDSNEGRAKEVVSTYAEKNGTDLSKQARKGASRRKQIPKKCEDNDNDLLTNIDNTPRLGDDNEPNEMQRQDQPSRRSLRPTEAKNIVRQGDTQTIEIPIPDAKRWLRPRGKAPNQDIVIPGGADGAYGRSTSVWREDYTPADEVPAPRLAKLGRKSIRSREVIGFIFEEDQDPYAKAKQKDNTREEPTNLDLPQDRSTAKQCCQTITVINDKTAAADAQSEADRDSRSTVLPAAQGPFTPRTQDNRKLNSLSVQENLHNLQQEIATATTTAPATKQPIPPIINPATRGKKAAKPSDAAGQMPICPLPADLAVSSPIYQNARKMNTQCNLGEGMTDPMPGFSKANGGPWSREAHDLFDFKRPS